MAASLRNPERSALCRVAGTEWNPEGKDSIIWIRDAEGKSSVWRTASAINGSGLIGTLLALDFGTGRAVSVGGSPYHLHGPCLPCRHCRRWIVETEMAAHVDAKHP